MGSSTFIRIFAEYGYVHIDLCGENTELFEYVLSLQRGVPDMGRHTEKLLDGLSLEIEGEPNSLFGDAAEVVGQLSHGGEGLWPDLVVDQLAQG